MVSCIWDNGKASFLVWEFNWQKLMQNLSPPSFFETKTTALHHVNLLYFMAPTLSMWSKCSFTSLRRIDGMFRGLSLKGLGSVTSIMCSMALVHPISPSSNAKMSWYSANKFKVYSLFSSAQDSSSKSSSFLNRSFLVSFMESPVQTFLAHLWVWRAPTVPFATTVSKTSFAATILATGVPFFKTMGWSLVLYSWT